MNSDPDGKRQVTEGRDLVLCAEATAISHPGLGHNVLCCQAPSASGQTSELSEVRQFAGFCGEGSPLNCHLMSPRSIC